MCVHIIMCVPEEVGHDHHVRYCCRITTSTYSTCQVSKNSALPMVRDNLPAFRENRDQPPLCFTKVY